MPQWEDAFRAAGSFADDESLLANLPSNKFDQEEWHWQRNRQPQDRPVVHAKQRFVLVSDWMALTLPGAQI
jgi:hypothetical protein